jgi:hypothetical protein
MLAAAGQSGTGNREETTMQSAFHYDLMQARHRELMRSAEQQRLAAHVKAARRARRDDVAVRPGRRVRRLAWRLLFA